MFSLLVNAIKGLLPFFAALNFGGDRLNFNLLHRAREVMVEWKGVIGVYITSMGMLLQYLIFGTSQRLKMSFEFHLVDYRSFLYVLSYQDVSACQMWLDENRYTEYDRKSSSPRFSKRRRITRANVETLSSCVRVLNLATTSALPKDSCQVRHRPWCLER